MYFLNFLNPITVLTHFNGEEVLMVTNGVRRAGFSREIGVAMFLRENLGMEEGREGQREEKQCRERAEHS